MKKRQRWADQTEDFRKWWLKHGSNGCGPKGGWIKPPYRNMFKASCDVHDFGYSSGGTEADRLNADAHFLGAMVIDAAKLKWWRRGYFLFWCWLYFRAVRWGGAKSFTYGNYRSTDEMRREALGQCWNCGDSQPELRPTEGRGLMCYMCAVDLGVRGWVRQ